MQIRSRLRDKVIQKEKQRRKKDESEKRHTLNARRKSVKPLRYFTQKAQQAFNQYIRTRDADSPCISCGRHHTGQYHAGHYLTTGAHPELRFDEDNCHKQCSVCNNHLSGNIENYTPKLIEKIGIERFERLMGVHALKKRTRDELEAIAKHYRDKTKASCQQEVA